MSVSFTIPDAGDVSAAVRRVMRRHPRVESQRELSELVLKDLADRDPRCRVSGDRIRRIAVSSGAAKVEISYRDAPRSDPPDVCPVCGSAMAPVTNMTLDGGVTEFKRSCTVCPFSAGQQARAPARYVFLRAPEHELSEEEVRIRKLRKAASLLRGAERLISEAVEGTDFPDRKEFAVSRIEEILRSKEAAGSIPNLEADVRDIGHGDPLWTKPLAPPKYPKRKD